MSNADQAKLIARTWEEMDPFDKAEMRIACSIGIAALIVCLHPDAVRRIAAAIHLVRALLGDMRLH